MVKSDPRHEAGRRLVLDLAMTIGGALATAFLLAAFDAFEALHEFSRSHEDWELDDIILAAAASSLWLAFFALRQWSASRKHAANLTDAERALYRIHDEMDFMAAAAPGAFYVRDGGEQGTIVHIGAKVEEQFGYTPDDFRSDPWFLLQRIHPDDRDAYLAAQDAIFVVEETKVEYRFHHADGSYRWVEDHTVLLRDDHGRPEALVGYLHDSSVQRHFREELEAAVAARTSELSAVNRALEQEIAERQATAAKLRLEEERSARLVADLPGFVYVRDADHERRISFMSEGVVRVLGYEASAFRGEQAINLCDVIHPEDRDAVRRSRERMLELREASDCEYRVRTAQGEERWVWERLRGVYGDSGELQRFEGYVEDITDRKEMEEALRTSRDHLDIVTNNLPFAVSYVDGDERLISANKTFRNWLGQPLEDMIGKPLSEIVTRDTYAAMAPLIQEVLTGRRAIAEGHGDYAHGNSRIVHRDYVPNVGPDGEPDGFVMIVRDITEQKEAEEQRWLNEERLTQATEIAGIGYYVWDAIEDRCVFCSEEHARLHGLSPEQYIDRAAQMEEEFSLTHPEDRAFVKRQLQALRAGSKVDFEYRILLADGTSRHVREIIRPVFDSDGRVIQEIGTSQNITATKLAQQSLEERERRLRAAARMAKLGHYAFDVERDRYTFCSTEYARIHGLTVEEFMTSSMTANDDLHWVHPDDRQRYVDAFQSALDRRKPFNLEYRIIGKDGKERYVRDVEHTVEVEEGRVVRTEGTLQDITDIKQAEDSLAEGERRLRTAAQMAKLGHFVWDLVEDRCLYCSEELARIHGLSVEEYMERSLSEGEHAYAYLHPDDRDRYLEALERTYDACEPVDIEYRIIRADGAVRHVHEIEHLFLAEGGVPQRSEGIIQDITVAKEAQASLAESERRLRTAAQMAKLGHFVWDLVEDRCLYCSEELAALHGLSVEQYLERAVGVEAEASKFLHPDDRERYLEALRDGYKRQEPLSIEYRIIDANGDVRHVREVEHSFAVENGIPRRSEGIVQDITEIRRAERSLAESEQRLRTAAQMAKLGHFVWDLVEDRCTYFSEEAARIFGVSVEEYIERAAGVNADASNFVHPDDQEHYLEALRRTFEAQEPINIEYRIIRSDGEVRHLREVEHVFQTENGQPLRSEGIVQDITETKLAEEQLRQVQKMDAIGQLTGGLAHDFNNLLTVVLGNLQLIERRVKDDERLVKRVDTAIHAAQRGAELTKSLLAFSRRQRLDSQVINLNEAVSGMQQLLRTTVSEQIELRLDLADALRNTAVDPAQLESALLNLVINARDAMPEGGRLLIETKNEDLDEVYAAKHQDVQAGPYVMLSVTDSGTGMSPEVQKHVFEPFFTTKDVGKGTGLGLSMVFGFIKQSGGHVALYSEEGSGTSFKLFLPAVEAEGESAGEHSSSLECPRGDETILVVEDQDEVRQTSLAILEELGYRVYSAGNGPSALELLDRLQSEIDLLFTDIVMPQGMNGLELAEKAREMRPDLKVLYTSGFSEAALKQEGDDQRHRDWLAKPFFNHTLAQKVREVLDRSQSGQNK